jgi:hypothetical protein
VVIPPPASQSEPKRAHTSAHTHTALHTKASSKGAKGGGKGCGGGGEGGGEGQRTVVHHKLHELEFARLLGDVLAAVGDASNGPRVRKAHGAQDEVIALAVGLAAVAHRLTSRSLAGRGARLPTRWEAWQGGGRRVCERLG